MSICFRRHGENEVRQVHQYQGHSSWWNRAGSLSPSLVFQRDGCSTARWLWWTCTTTMRWTSVLWKRRTWVCLSIGCDADCWKSRVSPLLISFLETMKMWFHYFAHDACARLTVHCGWKSQTERNTWIPWSKVDMCCRLLRAGDADEPSGQYHCSQGSLQSIQIGSHRSRCFQD